MQLIAPRAPYTSRLLLGRANSGLVGTIRFRLVDNDGDQNDPVYGPSTANIIEDPTGSGSYVFTAGVAPVTSRLYSRLWDTGPNTELVADESLFVTSTVSAPGQPSGFDLCTLEDVKRYVPSYVPNDATDQTLQDLITAASTLIPWQSKREIVPVEAVQPAERVFTVDRLAHKRRIVEIGDLSGTAGLLVATLNRDGTADATIASGVYVPLYDNKRQPSQSWEPVTELAFPAEVDDAPDLHTGDSVQVTGTWGFPEIPAFIREATAARVILRYISEIDAHGSGFAAAVRDSGLNLGGLFQSSQDALAVLGGR